LTVTLALKPAFKAIFSKNERQKPTKSEKSRLRRSCGAFFWAEKLYGIRIGKIPHGFRYNSKAVTKPSRAAPQKDLPSLETTPN
jgi:hypothetical protein